MYTSVSRHFGPGHVVGYIVDCPYVHAVVYVTPSYTICTLDVLNACGACADMASYSAVY